eukprot:CAMPEP_0182914716 /NCGR_PEP_ID=MMETSP0034_2-20130328/38713_1 /TAXON_ID=156128 /ORGANISM="Nephroselmis pyriformis, Strain CCMP717" /LENGTH=1302 /DNA_ID=CAMNT_0025051499 /DNA_START=117 /DNA_END=4022 /DNA_ORIENTATION=+
MSSRPRTVRRAATAWGRSLDMAARAAIFLVSVLAIAGQVAAAPASEEHMALLGLHPRVEEVEWCTCEGLLQGLFADIVNPLNSEAACCGDKQKGVLEERDGNKVRGEGCTATQEIHEMETIKARYTAAEGLINPTELDVVEGTNGLATLLVPRSKTVIFNDILRRMPLGPPSIDDIVKLADAGLEETLVCSGGAGHVINTTTLSSPLEAKILPFDDPTATAPRCRYTIDNSVAITMSDVNKPSLSVSKGSPTSTTALLTTDVACPGGEPPSARACAAACLAGQEESPQPPDPRPTSHDDDIPRLASRSAFKASKGSPTSTTAPLTTDVACPGGEPPSACACATACLAGQEESPQPPDPRSTSHDDDIPRLASRSAIKASKGSPTSTTAPLTTDVACPGGEPPSACACAAACLAGQEESPQPPERSIHCYDDDIPRLASRSAFKASKGSPTSTTAPLTTDVACPGGEPPSACACAAACLAGQEESPQPPERSIHCSTCPVDLPFLCDIDHKTSQPEYVLLSFVWAFLRPDVPLGEEEELELKLGGSFQGLQPGCHSVWVCTRPSPQCDHGDVKVAILIIHVLFLVCFALIVPVILGLATCVRLALLSSSQRCSRHRGVKKAWPRPTRALRATAAAAAAAIIVAAYLLRGADAITQSQALLAFKNGVSDPSGALSTWTGTVCGATTWASVACSGTNVVEVNLCCFFNFAGPLAPEFSALTAMTRLILSNNAMTGTIPAQLSTLASLASLFINNNAWKGPIPAQLSTLASLTYLGLHFNALTGTIPAQLSTLASLAFVEFQGNKLVGSIPPEFSVLSALGNFRAQANTHLCGTYTMALNQGTSGTALGTACSSQRLQTVALMAFRDGLTAGQAAVSTWNMANNILVCSGGPAWAGVTCSGTNVVAVERINLGLAGPLAPEFSALTLMIYLVFNNNFLTGTIPAQLSTMASLQRLWLYNNALTGTIPAQLSTMASLTSLIFYSNALTGRIPAQLSTMASLTYLWLYNNALTGTIPAQLSTMASLQRLYLYQNALTGTIPAQLSTMASLQYLWLYNNALTGTIPAQLSTMASLYSLWLYNNFLTGTIPAQLSTMASLRALWLYNNALTGTIPAQLSTMASLTSLYLNDNKLVGSIPAEFSVLSALSSANFQVVTNTHLCGTTTAKAPSSTSGTALGSACSSQRLQTVALMAFRDGLTAGQAAVSTWNMANNILVCGGTSWTGVTCSGSNVVAIERTGLGMTGPLAPDFSVLTSVTSINFENNALGGTLPPQWSTLSNVIRIVAFSNQLAGTLPTQWSTLSAVTRVWL